MDHNGDLHPIQKKILKRLGYESSKSFSEIRGDIESNKLAFHLKKLQEKDLIEKVEGGYRTTKEGRELLPYFDLETSRHPVIVVDVLVFSGEEVYLVPASDDPLDPFAGDHRAPSSRIGKNDRVRESAEQLFEEEFGESPESLKNSAVFDSEVEFLDGSKQHYILFFFKVETDRDLGENGYPLDELAEMNVLPGLAEVIQKAKWSESFFMGDWDLEETESGFEVTGSFF